MEAARSPLGHSKERKVGVDRHPAMHHNGLEAGASQSVRRVYGGTALLDPFQVCLYTCSNVPSLPIPRDSDQPPRAPMLTSSDIAAGHCSPEI